MERRGKSSPVYGRPYCYVNPIRCNTDKDVIAGPGGLDGWQENKFSEQARRRTAKIDCCIQQNSAYRLGHLKGTFKGAFFIVTEIFLIFKIK